ncbi:hypothetical protein HYDPIDRAFT_31153 [Hydnomerulius pinastri MD-312]|uniref:Uncharacterized protein n=1 Tax=Hydnomerulius pinastri MD-312 TaxID=994086 RepID=A0A0C9V7A1_9AGAM|nr:hypothetical protein HYDPIDRAFT_31153 [Hydnomerulius pinastri MD-312]
MTTPKGKEPSKPQEDQKEHIIDNDADLEDSGEDDYEPASSDSENEGPPSGFTGRGGQDYRTVTSRTQSGNLKQHGAPISKSTSSLPPSQLAGKSTNTGNFKSSGTVSVGLLEYLLARCQPYVIPPKTPLKYPAKK